MEPVIEHLSGQPAFGPALYDITALGYKLDEYTFEGRAQNYLADDHLSADTDRREMVIREEPYKSRFIVVLPKDMATFNGTVIVEWMNVTGGLDVPVVWVNAHREIMRKGYGYVAVSAQKVGIDGGTSRSQGTANPLKAMDPSRYASLSHPGDAFCFDIFSDVARVLRGVRAREIFGSLSPLVLLAAGESQSAIYLTTYVNIVDPDSKLYDGFLIHSRVATAAPLGNMSIFEAPAAWGEQVVRISPSLRVPVVQVVTETDVIRLGHMTGFHAARQPDGEKLRTWEIAGSAHADNYLFGVGMIDAPGVPIEQLAKAWSPLSEIKGMQLANPINNGPQHHYVIEAAIRHLDEWVKLGIEPPHADNLEVLAETPSRLKTDRHGNAIGGVRTPWVDVPISQLTGDPILSKNDLAGMVVPFGRSLLEELYPAGRVQYVGRFKASLDEAIANGFILQDDREEILQLAEMAFPMHI